MIILESHFKNSINTAIAAGLGALHIKDRMTSLNEFELGDIPDAAMGVLKKAGNYIANKAETSGLSGMARIAKTHIGQGAENFSNTAKQGMKSLGKSISRTAEDYRDQEAGKTGVFNNLKKAVTRTGEDAIDGVKSTYNDTKTNWLQHNQLSSLAAKNAAKFKQASYELNN